MEIPRISPIEIAWELLALLGVLSLAGILAVAFRLSIGKW
jgi:hypothetical protein